LITARGADPPAGAGFVPFAGEGFALLLPSKWNPSSEQEFGSGTILRCGWSTQYPFVPQAPGNVACKVPETPVAWTSNLLITVCCLYQLFTTVFDKMCRYADNFDAVNSLVVVESNSDKKSIEEYGSPEKFLEGLGFLFGKQAFAGEQHLQMLST
jgi:photosystem II oxygen-evolving enhancer protein 2